ncbi:MAG: M48 family metalloprotease [Patescibacteria group bacterium]|nr:M48 family metalloprotease [Patescibacteria group bacterium]
MVSDGELEQAVIRTCQAANIRQLIVGIVDDQEPSAGLIEPGRIVITEGLLTLVSSEGELAGVIAHEIAHLAHLKFSNLFRRLMFCSKDILLVLAIASSFRIRSLLALMLFGMFVAFYSLLMQSFIVSSIKRRNGYRLRETEQLSLSIGRCLIGCKGWIFVPFLIAFCSFTANGLVVMIAEYIFVLFYLGWAVKQDEYKADLKSLQILRTAGYDQNEFLSILKRLPERSERSWIRHHLLDYYPTIKARIRKLQATIAEQA